MESQRVIGQVFKVINIFYFWKSITHAPQNFCTEILRKSDMSPNFHPTRVWGHSRTKKCWELLLRNESIDLCFFENVLGSKNIKTEMISKVQYGFFHKEWYVPKLPLIKSMGTFTYWNIKYIFHNNCFTFQILCGSKYLKSFWSCNLFFDIILSHPDSLWRVRHRN